MRGGSWANNHINARGAYRNNNNPRNDNNNVGFRLLATLLCPVAGNARRSWPPDEARKRNGAAPAPFERTMAPGENVTGRSLGHHDHGAPVLSSA